MKEDLTPYMLPHSSGNFRPAPIPWDRANRRLRSLRSAAEPNPQHLEEMKALLSTATAAYVANFTVDSRIPYHVRQIFDRDMALFPQTFARQVSDAYSGALVMGMVTNKAITASYGALESGMNTLSAKLNRYDQEFSAWLALNSLQTQGYTRFLFVAEQSANSCDPCLSYHGQVFSLADAPIPPLHPNCRCALLAMDTQMEALYHRNETSFIETFRRMRAGVEGGLFLVDHGAFPFGLTPAHLAKVSLPGGHTITDLSDPAGTEGNGGFDLGAKVVSYFSTLASDAKDLLTALWDGLVERGERRWDSLGSFLDWLTLGIVSGVWRAASDRVDAVKEDPSLYNIVNYLSFGILDILSAALFPEDPFSLEHLLSMVDVLSLGFSAYTISRSVRSTLIGSADDAARAGVAPQSLLDDIARNTGLTRDMIDDIINTPWGQRPDPTTYLSGEYIEQHLDMFRNGVTKFYASSSGGKIGPSQGTYVMPSSMADDLLRQADGDISVLEQLLGLNPGDLGDAPVRIDCPTPRGLRMPSGNEPGANDYWLPGGYTTRGVPEAVVDQLQPGEYTVTPIK